eukprot:jgi/Bigna1/138506/aug1.45_g13214
MIKYLIALSKDHPGLLRATAATAVDDNKVERRRSSGGGGCGGGDGEENQEGEGEEEEERGGGHNNSNNKKKKRHKKRRIGETTISSPSSLPVSPSSSFFVCNAIRITLTSSVIREGDEEEEENLQKLSELHGWGVDEATSLSLAQDRASLVNDILNAIGNKSIRSDIAATTTTTTTTTSSSVASGEALAVTALRALEILCLGCSPSELVNEVAKGIHSRLSQLHTGHPEAAFLIRALGIAAKQLAPPEGILHPTAEAFIKQMRSILNSCLKACMSSTVSDQKKAYIHPSLLQALVDAIVSISAGDPDQLSVVVDWRNQQRDQKVSSMEEEEEEEEKEEEGGGMGRGEHPSSAARTVGEAGVQPFSSESRRKDKDRDALILTNLMLRDNYCNADIARVLLFTLKGNVASGVEG